MTTLYPTFYYKADRTFIRVCASDATLSVADWDRWDKVLTGVRERMVTLFSLNSHALTSEVKTNVNTDWGRDSITNEFGPTSGHSMTSDVRMVEKRRMREDDIRSEGETRRPTGL